MRSLFIASSRFLVIAVAKTTFSRALPFQETHRDQIKMTRVRKLKPRAGVTARGRATQQLRYYCFEPVVLLFGFGEQFRFCGFASFSQAAKLAYLQLRPPLADVLMQNAALPMVCCFCMLLPEEGEPIVPCAWANEIPATSAATAVRIVKVFMICLLGG
jgi:hypothetical protein